MKTSRHNTSAKNKSPKGQRIACPECGSDRVWKDGKRRTKYGEFQRYICRSCGFRFTEPTGLRPFRSAEQSLNRPSEIVYNRQVCVTVPRGAKNLVEVEAREKSAMRGATADIKGKLVEFIWWLKKQGYSPSTIKCRVKVLKRMMKHGVGLAEPEEVKNLLAVHEEWSANYKNVHIDAYTSFLKFIGMTWDPPKYRAERELPFIPLEKEIDALIAGSSRKVAASLQILKETGMRIGEAWKLRWTDLDEEKKTLKCRPLKHGNPRMFKVSDKLISMLNSLPKRSEFIFGSTYLRAHRYSFVRQRKRLADKLNNPRLNRIHFHTLRHWKGTTEYHRTKDILYVKNLLGHKKIESTLLYTQLAKFEETDEFHVKTASDPEEIKSLLEVGFEYVCTKDGLVFFRKRK